ncbi:hypothetical protein NADE_001806 [Nannochloris sp. 'desiccata']|nr:hypothetical protein KSW81_001342 [Chlorella desiccata (nom. nud.)]KAH7617004.1 hypothetical protein NADE_001806 [Chlorella desiccata (nom. nud.)]
MSDLDDDVPLDPQVAAEQLAKIAVAEAAAALERKRLCSAFNKAKKSFQNRAGRLSRHTFIVGKDEASLSGKKTVVKMRKQKTPQGGAGLDETLQYALEEGWLSTQQVKKMYEISEILGAKYTVEDSDTDSSDSDSDSDDDDPAPRRPTIRRRNASTARSNAEDEEPAEEGAATDLAQSAGVFPDGGSISEGFLPEEGGELAAAIVAPSARGIANAEQAGSVALPLSAVGEPPVQSKEASQDSMAEIAAAGAGLRSDALPAPRIVPRLPVEDLGPELQQDVAVTTEAVGNARKRRPKRTHEDVLTGEELEKTLDGIDAPNRHAGPAPVQDNANPNRRKKQPQLELTTEEVKIFGGIIEKCHKEAFLASGGKQPTGYAATALESIWKHYNVDTHPEDHERVKVIVLSDAWIRNNLKRFFGKDFNGRNDFKHVKDFIAAEEVKRSEHSVALQVEAGLGLGAPGYKATGQACFEWIENLKQTHLKVDNAGVYTCTSNAITENQVTKLYDRVQKVWLKEHGNNSSYVQKFNSFLIILHNLHRNMKPSSI